MSYGRKNSVDDKWVRKVILVELIRLVGYVILGWEITVIEWWDRESEWKMEVKCLRFRRSRVESGAFKIRVGKKWRPGLAREINLREIAREINGDGKRDRKSFFKWAQRIRKGAWLGIKSIGLLEWKWEIETDQSRIAGWNWAAGYFEIKEYWIGK